MKTTHTHNASTNQLGAILLLSLFNAALMSFPIETLLNLYDTCINQWHIFTQCLATFYPHRTF